MSSFIDCIMKQVQEGQLQDFEARDIQRRYTESYNQSKAQGLGDAQARDIAAKRIEADEAMRADAKESQVAQRVALHKVNEYFRESGLPPGKAATKFLETVHARRNSVKNEVYQIMEKETFDMLNPGLSGLRTDHAKLVASVSKIVGGNFDATSTGRIAKNLNDMNQHLVKLYKMAGVDVRELENYVPPVHNRNRITQAGKEVWVQDMKRLVGKRTKTDSRTGELIPEDKLDELLRDAYDGITTGHKDLRDAALDMGMVPPDSSAYRGFINKRNKSRFIHFDSGDAFVEYNRKYGRGDDGLAAAILNNFDSLATDIAMAQKLGPNPAVGIHYMKEKIKSGPDKVLSRGKKYYTDLVDDHFQILRGYGLDPDNIVHAAIGILLNTTRSAQLGMAGLSAIPDAGMLRSAAKLKGASANRILMFYGQTISGSAESKTKAARASMMADMLTEVMRSGDRMSGDIGKANVDIPGVAGQVVSKISGAMDYTASQTNKLSFLNKLTRAGKQAGMMEALATASDTAKTPWSKLNDFWKDGLVEFGINERHWKELNKLSAGFLDINYRDEIHGRASFLDTGSLRSEALKKNNFTLMELANSLDDMAQNMSILGTNEGTLATKAIVSGKKFGGKVGGRLMFQYLNFPMSVLLNHMVPHMKNAMKGRGVVGFADAMAITTALGYASIIAKDIANGKTKPEIFGEETYLNEQTFKRAFLQGGSGSFVADIIDLEYGGYRNSFSEAIVRQYTTGRPVPSILANGIDLIADSGKIGRAAMSGDVDFEKFYADTKKMSGQMLIRHVPFGNLFYIRAVADSLFFDGIRRLSDENYEESRQKYLDRMNESNQDLWFDSSSGRVDLDKLSESFSLE